MMRWPAGLLTFLALAIAPLAHAQDDYPNRTVRIIVPFAPGGSTDVVARILADKLGTELKQSFVVENRSGAGGNIGADAVAKASPDGYTLLMGTTGVLAINKYLYKEMSFDPERDLVPVSYTSLITNILVVNPQVPAKTVSELVALARAKPGSLTFASSGAGSSTHLSAELFKSMAGVDILHVPYKGSSQAITDLMGGQVTMLFDNAPSSIPFVEQGKLRALAVTTPKRSPALPDVMTMAEAGLPGQESDTMSGVVVPAHTPPPIIELLHHEIGKAMIEPEAAQKLASLGFDTIDTTPEEFSSRIQTEIPKWAKVIQTAGIKAE